MKTSPHTLLRLLAPLSTAVACSCAPSPAADRAPALPACQDSLDYVYTGENPGQLLVVGDTVYFFDVRDAAPGYVDILSLAPGGKPTTVAEVAAQSPLMTDGTSLYWLSPLSTGNPGLGSVPLTGGVPSYVAAPAILEGWAFVLDGSSVYALVGDAAPSSASTLVAQPLAGGPAQTLATLTISDTASLFDEGDQLLVVDGAQLYFVPKDGSQSVSHVAPPSDVRTVFVPASGGTSSFFANDPEGALESYAVDGGVKPLWATDAVPFVTNTVTVAPDGTAYFSGYIEHDDGLVDLAFGVVRPNQLATLTSCPAQRNALTTLAVAVGASEVYVTLGASIVRLPR